MTPDAPSPGDSNNTGSTPFEAALSASFDALRRRLDELFRATGVDPCEPQEAARRLGISRNLTWKVSRVIQGSDAYEALQHLPGAEGLEVLVRAALQKGAPRSAAESLREARADLDRVVETHAGDWGTLDLILDGLVGAAHDRLLQSRKLAFRGLSGIWGIQADARLVSFLLAPSRVDASRVDVGMMGGMVGIRRLRPGVRWPIFRPSWYRKPAEPDDSTQFERAMDPAWKPGDGAHLLRAFCSPGMPDIRLARDGAGWAYILDAGPVGKTASIDCFFGTIWPNAESRYATPQDQTGDLYSVIPVPVAALQLDVFIHKDVQLPPEPDVIAKGQLDATDAGLEPQRVPLAERVVQTQGNHSPLYPRYADLVTLAAERMGHPLADFRSLRLSVAFPPLHSTVLLRFRLPDPPADA